MLQVVIHLNEENKWSTVFSNVANLLQAAPDTKIKVVVNGQGVRGYFAQELQSEFQTLISNGVSFYACEQALKGQQKTTADLPVDILSVPSGILYLSQLQGRAYSYIKP